MKCHSLVQISLFFKKTKLTLLKSIHLHFKTPTKQMLGIFKQNWEKSDLAKILSRMRARL